ncbi:MAG: hypothetical protein QOJ14_2227 [Thermoleophilaceae bacterium]|jgi:hypothetical protein|nr:hypothetical protein [Thermoleophilaceae bacterium]
MPEEIIPGLLHWTAPHPNIGFDVSSHFVIGSRTLIDPLLPDGGIELGAEPERIVLSTRHHRRSIEEFDCPIFCHESGLHEFEKGPAVQGFAWGDQLAPDVKALEVDAISPDETGLLIDAGGGALLLADAAMHYVDEVHFVPDQYMVDEGDDPEPVKLAIREALSKLLDLEFDALLFAHGSPIPTGGKEALRRFVEQPPETPQPPQ